MADTRAQELTPWLDLMAVWGEVIVQFWLRPGETAGGNAGVGGGAGGQDTGTVTAVLVIYFL